jgi:DNA-binding response OmpR family regulator
MAETAPVEPHILYLENDKLIQQSLGELLTLEGHRVSWVTDGPAALVVLEGKDSDRKGPVDLVIFDVLGNGSFIEELRGKRFGHIPRIAVTGDASFLINNPDETVFPKPFELNLLLAAIDLKLNPQDPAA